MEKESLIDITVIPRSSKRGITLCEDSSCRVHLNSPPVDGQANAECIELFAKAIHVPRSRIEIARGEKGRKKRLRISGMSQDELMQILRSVK